MRVIMSYVKNRIVANIGKAINDNYNFEVTKFNPKEKKRRKSKVCIRNCATLAVSSRRIKSK